MAEDKKSRACHYLQPQEWWFADKTPIESVFLMMYDAASRGLSTIVRHRRDSSPADEAVGGLIFDFERISGEIATRYIYHTQVQRRDHEVEKCGLDALFQVLES